MAFRKARKKVFVIVDDLDELTDETKGKVKNFPLSESKIDWRGDTIEKIIVTINSNPDRKRD